MKMGKKLLPFYPEVWGRTLILNKLRPELRKYLFKAGIYNEPYSFFGWLFYISVIITILLFFGFIYDPLKLSVLYFFIYFFSGLLIAVGIIIFIIICVYFYVDLKIYNRTRKLELILPDFLDSVSSNLKGGMSFEKALWNSIKPRFGILSNEVALAGKKVMTGHDIEDALNELSMKYDSPELRRVLDLIVSEIKSGGKVSDIIDSLVQNLKKTRQLKEEMYASVLSYIIFIALVIIIIAPILFALAQNLLAVVQRVLGLLSVSGSSGNVSFLSEIKSVPISKEKFINFSRGALFILALFSSMIVSIIEKGSVKGGIKYIPIFVVSSQLFYMLVTFIFSIVFSSIISF